MAEEHLPTGVRFAVEKLLDALGHVLGEGQGLEALEDGLAEALSAVGVATVEAKLEALDPGGEVEADGVRYWQAINSSKEYICRFGIARPRKRGLYRAERNGPTMCP